MLFNLQATRDTRSARRRSALSYEPPPAHSTCVGWHSAWEWLCKGRREIPVTVPIAIRWLCKSACCRMHGLHLPSPTAPVRTHVHAIPHEHSRSGVPNVRSTRCPLQDELLLCTSNQGRLTCFAGQHCCCRIPTTSVTCLGLAGASSAL